MCGLCKCLRLFYYLMWLGGFCVFIISVFGWCLLVEYVGVVVYCLCFGLGFAVFAFCGWCVMLVLRLVVLFVFVDCIVWLVALFCYVVVCFLFWVFAGWFCMMLIVLLLYILCCVMIILTYVNWLWFIWCRLRVVWFVW